ncbi:MAG TPA: 50S ribosomal protein L5 [Candidatus Moranbacteria bacterium]|nr:50S ribosomal protein L5 [Candidatus Moranbacteria bacterium]
MNSFQKKYQEEVVAKMMEELKIDNQMAVPRFEKVALNIGLSRAEKDQNFIENVTKDIRSITGQAPTITKAKKAISGFKIRQGQKVGMRVTLRGKKMWDFLDRFVGVALPRTKDFQGISLSNLDERGNLNLGIKEQLIFPEIRSDETDTIFGLQVNIKTTAESKEEGLKLFKLMGFPIKE